MIVTCELRNPLQQWNNHIENISEAITYQQRHSYQQLHTQFSQAIENQTHPQCRQSSLSVTISTDPLGSSHARQVEVNMNRD